MTSVAHHGLRTSLVLVPIRRIVLELGLPVLIVFLLHLIPVLLEHRLHVRRRQARRIIRSYGSLAAALGPLWWDVLLARPLLPTTVRAVQLDWLLKR